MKISIISDSHDQMDDIKVFLKTEPEYIIHCGDFASPEAFALFKGRRMTAVLGNCDKDFSLYSVKAPAVLRERVAELAISGKRIAVNHGNDERLLRDLIGSGTYDVVCTGHTHVAEIRKEGATMVINPGSLAGIRSGTKTFAVLDTETLEAEIRVLG